MRQNENIAKLWPSLKSIFFLLKSLALNDLVPSLSLTLPNVETVEKFHFRLLNKAKLLESSMFTMAGNPPQSDLLF